MTPEQIAELIRDHARHGMSADRYVRIRIEVVMGFDHLTDAQRLQQIRDTLAARALVSEDPR